jgi:hypothetical protein
VRACPISASARAIASFCSFVQPVFAPTLTSRATSPVQYGAQLHFINDRCAAVVASVAGRLMTEEAIVSF